jgi:metal-responsive CopG/Arc/MetJ family transcriptional regulator
MLAIKTAISIDRDLYDEAEGVAKEMKVPRSKVFAIAMKDFIERRKNKALFEQINAAYSSEQTTEEQTLRRVLRQQHKRVVEREW